MLLKKMSRSPNMPSHILLLRIKIKAGREIHAHSFTIDFIYVLSLEKLNLVTIFFLK